jgi:hypothetical protein
MEINPIELASELSHVATQRSLGIADSVEMYIEDENGNHVYKDDVQDEFNDWYDYYLTMIENCEEVSS